MPRKFYRTVFEIEVLSDTPIAPDTDLEDVLFECNNGGYSGRVSMTAGEVVSEPRMKELLQAQGSDPDFFVWNEFYRCGNCGAHFEASDALWDAESTMHCPDCASSEVGAVDDPPPDKEDEP
jgi:hypothetical protein